MYKYFVSFAHGSGFGNCTVERSEPWGAKTAKSVADSLQELSPHLYQHTVLFFQRLEDTDE